MIRRKDKTKPPRGLRCYTLLLPEIKDKRKSTMKMKKRTLAMLAAPAAMPKNPKIPAMIAMMRKITVQRNIIYNLHGE
jgi:hypothetical protein